MIIEVCHLKKELDLIVLWLMHKNNVCLLTTRMVTVLQEIHAKTGKHFYTDQRFITNLFCALESSPTEKFLAFVDQLKSQWIMEKISLPSDIILKLDKTHRNMVADNTLINMNEKDTKIVVLTSALQEVKKKFGDLAKKVSFKQDKPKDIPKKGGDRPGGGRCKIKACCPKWQVTKKGNTIKHKGHKYIWCSHHASKDGSINSLYMPFPRDHKGWAKTNAKKTTTFKKRKEEEKKKLDSNVTGNKKPKKDEALKLALSSKLTTALVTQHHVSQADAEAVFDSVYKDVVADGKEN